MAEIKHLLGQSGTYQQFKLVVQGGTLDGEHLIEMPDKFEEIDVKIDVDEELFNINNFIIGDSEKLTFLEYSNPIGFKLVRDVYEELGSDAIVVFKWLAINGGTVEDVLGDEFELNFNKYELSYEESMLKIELSLKRRESHNKLLTREDVSINLLDTKDLDGAPIPPLTLDQIYYKEVARSKSNFFFLDDFITDTTNKAPFSNFMFHFYGSDDNDLGVRYTEDGDAGKRGLAVPSLPFLFTRTDLKSLSVEVSNMKVESGLPSGATWGPEFSLEVWKNKGGSIVEKIVLLNSVPLTSTAESIEVVNQSFDIGGLKTDETLYLWLVCSDPNGLLFFKTLDASWSIEVHANLDTPLRRTQMVRLSDALTRLSTMAVGSTTTLSSSILGVGGEYHDTAITTGIHLRGVANIFLGENKLTTSLKGLLYDSVAPLLACGFDIQSTNLIVEPLTYFFNNSQAYDFSDKDFARGDFSSKCDADILFNQIYMGSKKYSTNKKGDLLNYNTELEALTPLVSVKTKLDKRVEAVLDEDKIQELIADTSSASSDSDDEIVLLDLVEASNYRDTGVLTDCVHSISTDGYLQLTSYATPFDTLALSVGMELEILSGPNMGIYTILDINRAVLKLNKTSGIVEAEAETPIAYIVNGVLKNRASEGFYSVLGVRDIQTCSNLRHNPKYQMARWAPYYLSGLSKKSGLETIKVTNYKNNGSVTLDPSPSLGELQGVTTLNEEESLLELRLQENPLFSGELMEVTLVGISFDEFMSSYKAWRFGVGGRGFFTVPTPIGSVDLYPWGDGAISFSGIYNELTIKGRPRHSLPGVSLNLLSVFSPSANTVDLTWDYVGLDGATVLIEATTDEGSWTQIGSASIEDLDTTITSSFFDQIVGTATVYFRITANLNDTIIFKSNVVHYPWPHVPQFVVNVLSKTENVLCGQSEMEFEVLGIGTVDLQFSLLGDIGSTMALFENGNNWVDTVQVGQVKTRTHTLVEGVPKKYKLYMYSADTLDGYTYLYCNTIYPGDVPHQMYAEGTVNFINPPSTQFNSLDLVVNPTKYERIHP